jgi:hypothetical protein
MKNAQKEATLGLEICENLVRHEKTEWTSKMKGVCHVN